MRRQLTLLVCILAAAIAGLVYTFIAGNEPLLGLDLQGGVSVVLEPVTEADDEAIDQAVEIIRNRVDGLGVAEPEVTRQGEDVLVQLPGVDDTDRALELVGQTAELRFRPVLDSISEIQLLASSLTAEIDGDDETEFDPDSFEIPPEWELSVDPAAADEVVLPELDDDGNIVVRYRLGPTGLTGEALETASAQLVNFEWLVAPTFKRGDIGINGFNALAGTCFTRQPTCPTGQIAIEIDDTVESAPTVQVASFERDAITITVGGGEDEAKDLAIALRFGALPVELEPQESRVVSATIGEDALDAGIIAGLVGLMIVSLYLFAYYRLLGVVAICSLAISGALLWVIIAWLGETQGLALTLAGVTGLIVSIGVSVDSNVVYFEHLKEDVRNGRTLRSAVDRAFPIAFATIVKADVASLIGALVLYFLTVGAVKGFALYLGLATVLDLVATYFFMGPAIRVLANQGALYEKPKWFGIPTVAEPADAGDAPVPAGATA